MIGGAAGLGISVAGLSVDGMHSAFAATRAGSVDVVKPSLEFSTAPLLAGGGSNTPFWLKLPVGASCKGDSAVGGYRIQSYLVPQSVDPGTLAFNSGGPVPVTGQFRQPMFDILSASYVDVVTANAVTPGGPGQIIQPLPSFDFAVYTPADFPFTPGVYNVGIACTLGPPSATQQEKYWNTVMNIVADPADPGPSKIKFTVQAQPPTTTTTTTVGGATTTTVGGATTTTKVGSSTTTTAPGSTTTTALGTTTTAPGGAAVSGSGGATSGGATAASAGKATALPRTGRSFLAPLMWAFLLVCSGRAALVFGRSPDRPADEG